MKKNILTTVTTATLFTGLALSSATAGSVLCFDGNTSIQTQDNNVSIDIKGQGVDVNLTLIPAAVYQGASFKIKFENGGLAENSTHLLCAENNGTMIKVGGLQEPGTPVDGVMVEPTFSFIDNDDVAAAIKKDSNITFVTGSDCTEANLTVVGLAGQACQTISAKITSGLSTQGANIPSIVTNSVSFGKTKTYIKVACTPPECFVTADKLKFTESAVAAGVNVALSAAGPATPTHNTTTSDCPECGETSVVNCVTTVTIENGNDFNITGLDLVANFVDKKGAVNNTAFKPVIDVSVDGNETKAYSLGSKFSPSGLSIGKDANETIQLTFTPNGTDMIETGTIVADITKMDSNIGTDDIIPTFIGKGLATIKVGAKTQFTVPYMSSAGASQANFVKVSTLVGASTTPLSAVVSDAKGNSCNVTYTDVPANGGSTFIFASKLPTGDDYQALIPAGECTNLTSNLYSVKFTAGASVNAVGYMRTKRGERTISVF